MNSSGPISLHSVSPDIPWHVTAFHQDYRMTENANTTAEQRFAPARLGAMQGCATSTQETFLACGTLGKYLLALMYKMLVRGYGYLIQEMNLTPAGTARVPHDHPRYLVVVRRYGSPCAAASFLSW